MITNTLVFNGEAVWSERNGVVTDGVDEDLEVAQAAAYEMYVSKILPLCDRDMFKLEPLPGIRIMGKDTVGVRVSSRGYPIIHLYFDKRNWLVVKLYRSKERTRNGKPREEYYENYKKINDEIMFPTKKTVWEGGEKHLETELVDIKPLSKVKSADFAKP